MMVVGLEFVLHGFKQEPGRGGINSSIGITIVFGRIMELLSGMIPIIISGMRLPFEDPETTYFTGLGAGRVLGSSACVDLIGGAN